MLIKKLAKANMSILVFSVRIFVSIWKAIYSTSWNRRPLKHPLIQFSFLIELNVILFYACDSSLHLFIFYVSSRYCIQGVSKLFSQRYMVVSMDKLIRIDAKILFLCQRIVANEWLNCNKESCSKICYLFFLYHKDVITRGLVI